MSSFRLGDPRPLWIVEKSLFYRERRYIRPSADGDCHELLTFVSARRPVELEREWLDPEISKAHALSLLQPYAAEAMVSVAASPLVNSVRNDDPSLLVAETLAA
jgi:hypothetical protein